MNNTDKRNPKNLTDYQKHFFNLQEKGKWELDLANSFYAKNALASPGIFARQNLLYLESIVLYHNSPEGFTVHRKNYNSYQIVYSLSGLGELVYLGRAYQLPANSCFLIDCQSEHHYRTIGSTPWIHHGMQFNGHQMKSIMNYVIEMDSLVVTLPNTDHINDLHEKLHEAAQTNLGSSDIVINQLLFDLIGQILLSNQFTSNKQLSGKVKEICNYIDQHYADIVSIDDISANCFISKFHMCREFKKQTGKTVQTYLSDRQIEAAKRLLLHSELPISEIAALSGFNSENYFYYVFKKRETITPLQYRKLHIR